LPASAKRFDAIGLNHEHDRVHETYAEFNTLIPFQLQASTRILALDTFRAYKRYMLKKNKRYYTITLVQKLGHKLYLFPFSKQQKINQQAESRISEWITSGSPSLRAESMKMVSLQNGQTYYFLRQFNIKTNFNYSLIN
jgi:hypothetical protein